MLLSLLRGIPAFSDMALCDPLDHCVMTWTLILCLNLYLGPTESEFHFEQIPG